MAGQQNFNSKRFLLPRFSVNYKDFLRGHNSYQKYPDGGFENTVIGTNMWAERGYMATSPDPLFTSDIPLVGASHAVEVVAWADGLLNNGGNPPIAELAAVAHDPQTGNGYFYKVDGGTGAFTLQDTDSARDYGTKVTNAVFMDGNYYITSTTDIAQWTGTGPATTQTYWTITKGQAPFTSPTNHFITTFLNQYLYVSDSNLINKITPALSGAASVQVGALVLPTGSTVDAMIEYPTPSASYLLIAAHQPNGRSTIYGWNHQTTDAGQQDETTSWQLEMPVEGIVSAMVIFQGIVYAFVPNGLLFFDGTKFKSIHSTGGYGISSPNQWQVSTNQDSMFFVDTYDTQILNARQGFCVTRYGRVINAGKTMNVFSKYLPYPDALGPTNPWRSFSLFISNFNTLFSTCLDASLTEAKSLYYSNGGYPGNFGLDNTSPTRTIHIPFNERHFQYPVRAHKLVARYKDIDPANGSTIKFGYTDHKGMDYTIGTLNANDLANQPFTREYDINDNPMTYMIQPWVEISENAKLYDATILYYLSEDVINA